jgi:hypothetical protein
MEWDARKGRHGRGCMEGDAWKGARKGIHGMGMHGMGMHGMGMHGMGCTEWDARNGMKGMGCKELDARNGLHYLIFSENNFISKLQS